MKKIVAAAASLTLACALATSAFAESPVTSIPGSDSATVYGTYQAGGSGDVVYSVDIAWEAMNFTYTAAGQGTWNPQDHQYDGGSQASWSGTSSITVTNHSNAAVKATASYEADTGFESADMTFGDSNGSTIATAVDTEVASAPSATITVTPTGSLPEFANGGKIGTITLSIAAE